MRYDKKGILVFMYSTRYSCPIVMELEFFFLDRFSKNPQISNFMKIRLVGAELFHADGQRERHDETNSHFSQFCKNTYKLGCLIVLDGDRRISGVCGVGFALCG